MVTMLLSTVPPVECKCAAAAAGPSLRLAQSDRFVRVLFGPLVEQPRCKAVQYIHYTTILLFWFTPRPRLIGVITSGRGRVIIGVIISGRGGAREEHGE